MLTGRHGSTVLFRSLGTSLRTKVRARQVSQVAPYFNSLFRCNSATSIHRLDIAASRPLPQLRYYAISTHAAKIKAPQCPTCGAAFQTDHPGGPGYLNDKKWKQLNQANLVQGLPTIEGSPEGSESADIPALTSSESNKGRSDDGDDGSKVLSKEQYEKIIRNLDDPELRAIFSGETVPGFVDPNNMVTLAAGSNPGGASSLEDSDNGQEKRAEPHSAIVASRLRRRAEQGRDRIVCQRCYKLTHHNMVEGPWKKDIVSDPRSLKFLRYKANLVVVVVCDIFDLPGSMIPHLGEFIGERHPVILVANKVDLLPKDYHKERLTMWFRRFARDLDLNIQAIHLVSSLKNLGTRELAADISERRRAGQDIYMVGRANVGKSELINALLRISIGGYQHKVLASHVPGTTMGLSGIPLRHFVKALVPVEGARPQDRQANLYDTPGVFSNKSLVSLLTNEELKVALCSKRITPFTYILNLGQSVMLGGLGRIDLVKGPDFVYVTVFANIRPHFTRTQRAVELTERMQAGESTVLRPPIGDADRLKDFPKSQLAVEHTFEGTHKRNATLDVAFAGIGWVAVTGQFPQATIQVFTPNGMGVSIRPPMMPFEYKKITPHTSSMRKTPK
ncbi:nitric oxide associated protein 1 [Coemansia sp. RSA 1722]|nr:nitric oxide associated protein 1 [Coemansia sp. RSA 486]KAJ2237859.1 nitric oxide associated protein 1 [Coemansia sp. RSA 485]KAJ2603289.1 nitric oxide associated protein 1 [Coemansia sp. RSA 1721]KAJ2605919.1 nitric oxide associated protein 1 [Coemansia sp. RSA 1722]KAJ2639921.1 nitric oxide associated protein 1 [Coemansia sp. RSA 1286]